MTPDAFINRWRESTLTERAASQSHFNDLCKLLGEPTPTEVDSKGDTFAFEKGAMKSTGGQGWADVWKRGCFAWEYKQPGKDLNAAFAQLQRYAVALENPPLLIVSDRDRFRIHTNWTNTVAETHEITVEELRDANKRQLLKWAFSEPERLKPKKSRDELTAEAAGKFADLATRLRERGNDPQQVAHFVNRLVFCMFAEDVDLLPKKMFSKMLDAAQQEPEEFRSIAASLFAAMRTGGRVGFEAVEWFNGGLFDDDKALSLDVEDIKLIRTAADLDWAGIDPAIFGTLFERGLDPDKRSQLGAHYTDRDKIMMIINPVINRPLTAEWERIKSEAENAIGKAARGSALTRARTKAKAAIDGFLDGLKKFRVLDPACGSGNFLHLALQELKDLEHRVNLEAEVLGFPRRFPEVGPQCVMGIELNPYAAELARVSIWIGEIQWMRRNGFDAARDPILKPLDGIECRDAILDSSGLEQTWPTCDVIIGNPPFLGDRRIVPVLGQLYADTLRRQFDGRVPGGADLVCYWFEKARVALNEKRTNRVGLVATNSIRGGLNRRVLESITAEAHIFEAWSDEPWVLDGAAVRVSIICFESMNGKSERILDGATVGIINADLTSGGLDLTKAKVLKQNAGRAFQGTISYGPFEIEGNVARDLIALPRNPNGRPNSDVVRPWTNGQDITKRSQDFWIIFFPDDLTEEQAALYEAPFELVSRLVKPARAETENKELNKKWWKLWRTRPEYFKSSAHLERVIVTPRVSKHRLFVWRAKKIVPDSATVVIVRDDDTSFGVLHSRFHELWTLRMCTFLGVGNDPRYTPSSTFDTFPFPEGLTPDIAADCFSSDPRALAIALKAKRLDELREAWLNPLELIDRQPEVVSDLPARLIPKDDAAAKVLRKRTLTKLYNDRPQWLSDAHKALDAAVAAAYGWPNDLTDDEVLARLFALNQERAAAEVQSN